MAEPLNQPHELPVGESPLTGRCHIHEDQRVALNVALTSLGHELRSFKQLEFQWFALYLTATLPAIAYMSTRAGGFPAGLIERVAVCGVYSLFTIWIMNVLFWQRQSYYRVLRMVRRLQTVLGFDSLKVMSEDMREQIFPKRFGRKVKEDNTKKRAGYTDRLVPVLVADLCLIVSVFKEPVESAARSFLGTGFLQLGRKFLSHDWVWITTFTAIAIGWFIWCLSADGKQMAKELLAESNLAGTYGSDYSNSVKPPSTPAGVATGTPLHRS